MHALRPLLRKSLFNLFAASLACAALLAPRAANAEALLLIEADSGKVLQADNATIPWYPASVTKIMTAYVTLKAVKDGRLTLDTLLTVSPTAASQSPSKMGFRPGTQLTVDNALKMMMVKSANDMAVVLAEGVGGSIDGFSAIMNDTAKKLGMMQTSYVNPNGLPADGQITSARDLGILARAFLRDLPEYEYFVHIPAIRFGKRVTGNFNKLIGRYPGADGFKTGFICASGYNLVASATRNGRRLIAVVLGASSGTARAVKAAQLLERGFAQDNLTWLRPSLGTVDNLVPIDASPPNLRDEMCGPHRKRPASDDDDALIAANGGATGSASATGGEAQVTFFTAGLQPPLMMKASELMASAPAAAEPVLVYTGPTRTGTALIAAVAADADQQAASKPRGKKSRVAKKPDAADKPKDGHKDGYKDAGKDTKTAAVKPDAKSESKSEAKSGAKGDAKTDAKTAAKPAGSKHAGTKHDAAAKPAEKPAAGGDQAAKPAKPKAATKPAAAAKPANNS
ncbi:D-alanyl-D-alanine carboxypeptidase family protein [Bradyrhizobium sp. I71]|uniref:D-alanyl-D-alanine carboxypeptidase family protein n=1 Tax=Bradyrhizobium sp. I71 TaxID=2590772 RepID=UPI001EF91DEB|nr:D-alanyl-D-alanine carboxypeptidase family protein [Bradyrhizobium sp. I71]ULL00661.1 D-alanyl-D-alanine carboxypeptidase [Bradyrhizobium sp. I71]